MSDLLTSQPQAPAGRLIVQVLSAFTNAPISGAQIKLSQPPSADELATLLTDASGMTSPLSLPAPARAISLTPSGQKPYAEYNLTITAPGYRALEIDGVEIYDGELSLQPAALRPADDAAYPENPIIIGENTLLGGYPEKLPEDEVKPVEASGEIVLSRVVVPETIVVHDGAPSDAGATDYFVPYKDYIKNVASSEIYSTWPRATITANVLAIMSFTLNRVYTEWYRNKGYDFTITSSTRYDQKWIYGRTIFQSISEVVDEIFTAYLSKPGVRQPLFTQYCDGRSVSCPGWLSQWGSASLGEQGMSAIDILRRYYGSEVYINTAEEIDGIPYSWPGSELDIGSSGPKVTQLQEQLNTIASAYPAIPGVRVDGIFGEETQRAVREFQSVFGLPVTGVVNYATWFKVSELYVAISKIAENVPR